MQWRMKRSGEDLRPFTALGICLGGRSRLLGLPEGLVRVSEQQEGRACVLFRRACGTIMLSRHYVAEE